MVLQYDYSQARQRCKEANLIFADVLIPHVDAEFNRAHLTQAQVDIVMDAHIWAVRYLFSPGSYSWLQRIALALHFLFGPKRI